MKFCGYWVVRSDIPATTKTGLVNIRQTDTHLPPPHLFYHSVVAAVRLFVAILAVWRFMHAVGEVELVADLSQHLEYHSGVLDELPIVVSHVGGPGRILNRQRLFN